MSDIFTKDVRSRIMSKIRAKDSRIEMSVRKGVWKKGYRFRKHYGKWKIDIAFPRKKVAVFVDSCFWHACPIHGEIPKSNVQFWKNKLTKNVQRDLEVNEQLKDEGWKVIRIWEHEIDSELDKTLTKISRVVDSRKVNS